MTTPLWTDEVRRPDRRSPESRAARSRHRRLRGLVPERVAELVGQAQVGDEEAFGKLFDAWLNPVFDAARRITTDEQTATRVTRDTFGQAWLRLGSFDRPESAGGWLLRVSRTRARGSADSMGAPLEDEGPVADRFGLVDEPRHVVADPEVARILWESLETLGERDAAVLDLHLRYGHAPAHVGRVIGTDEEAAGEVLTRLRNRLGSILRARLLWQGGQPRCEALAGALGTAAADRFDRTTAGIIARHASRCEVCTPVAMVGVPPGDLVAALPVITPPSEVAEEIAAALDEAGVPIDGSDRSPAALSRPTRGQVWRRRSGWVARRVAVATAAAALAFGIVAAVLLLTGRSTDHEEAAPTSTSNPTATTADPDNPFGVTPITAFTLNPTTVAASAPPAVLGWEVNSDLASTARLEGPNFLDERLLGSAQVCPGTVANQTCASQPGTYEYTLVAFDEAGEEVDRAAVTLTVQ